MPPSKRSAPNAPDSAPAKKRGRPAKNTIEESAIAREAAERTSENTRPFQRDNVDKFVGELVRPPGEGWSQAHEDAMNRMWQESEHSKAAVKMVEAAAANKGRTTYPYLLTLFKVCLRVFRMTPVRFLSFSHQLEYLGDRGSSAVFSKAFCEALTGLIVHPAFSGNKNKLSVVIQYAVICRIDDRRLWPKTDSPLRCPALAKMVEVMKQSDADGLEDSIHRTHTSVRRECTREEKTPSQLSDLLFEIGETVKRSGTKGPAITQDVLEYGGEVVRPVSLYDLRNIINTIDETTWGDESWNCTVAEALYSYQLVFQQQEVPNGEELPGYYERSHKRKLRDWMVKSGFEPHQQADEQFDFEDMEQDADHGESQPPSVDPPRSLRHALPVQTLSEAAIQQPDLIPERFNPYVQTAQRQEITSPTERYLLARIEDLEKEVAALKVKMAIQDKAVSHEGT